MLKLLSRRLSIDNITEKKLIKIDDFINKLNAELKYYKNNIYYCLYTVHSFETKFTVKISPYILTYGGTDDISCPQNTELLMLELLGKSNNLIHVIRLIDYFNIKKSDLVEKLPIGLDLNKIYKYHVIDYDDELICISILEYCDYDLLNYIRENCHSMTLEEWTIIIFQIIFTLAQIHSIYPSFRHNNLKAHDILLRKNHSINFIRETKTLYEINNFKFFVPYIGLEIKISSFDFACIDNVIENNKVNSNQIKQNRYYDMHYLFNTLITIQIFTQFYKYAPREIIEFFHRILPEEYRKYQNGLITKSGSILIDTEYTTPYDVIITDPLFKNFRTNSLFNSWSNVKWKNDIIIKID